MAGAIRNQFNLVGNTVNSGTTGGTEGGASGGGSTGADSATVQAAVAKDAKDWTLDEQEAVAKDIAKNGTSSIAYAKAKAAMDAGTKFSMKLTDGETLEYRIIGINHDNLADGSGKAGLTFLTTSGNFRTRMNATNTNVGGWEASELRKKLNSGEIWNLMPSDFRSKVKAVTKLTNNVDGSVANKDAVVTATTDKLFLLSQSEIIDKPYWAYKYSWLAKEGSQYEAFEGKNHSENSSIYYWERSVGPYDSVTSFLVVVGGNADGYARPASVSTEYNACPVWCF